MTWQFRYNVSLQRRFSSSDLALRHVSSCPIHVDSLSILIRVPNHARDSIKIAQVFVQQFWFQFANCKISLLDYMIKILCHRCNDKISIYLAHTIKYSNTRRKMLSRFLIEILKMKNVIIYWRYETPRGLSCCVTTYRNLSCRIYRDAFRSNRRTRIFNVPQARRSVGRCIRVLFIERTIDSKLHWRLSTTVTLRVDYAC